MVLHSWRDFWNGETAIYAGARHKAQHYALIASETAPFVASADAHVLDHGCGEALSAGALAAVCARLYLFDAAPNVRRKLHARFGGDARIVIVEDDGLDAIKNSSLDLVVANSLLQYLTRDELESLLALWRRMLKDTGRLVLADVAPPDVTMSADVRELLSFAHRGGFLLAAILSLARTFFSDYRALRRELGFSCYSERDLSGLLRRHGFTCGRLPRNIGHNQTRMSFIATKE